MGHYYTPSNHSVKPGSNPTWRRFWLTESGKPVRRHHQDAVVMVEALSLADARQQVAAWDRVYWTRNQGLYPRERETFAFARQAVA